MSISAVGSAGAAGAAATASQGQVAPASPTPVTQADAPTAGVGKSDHEAQASTGPTSAGQGSGPAPCRGMSTQDFLALNDYAIGNVQEAPSIDIQKLIELMMALKLLEAVSKGSTEGGGGFSGVA